MRRTVETVELEESFRLHSMCDLSALLKLLWPSNFVINVDGASLRLDGVSIQKSLHLYSSETSEHFRSRLRISQRRKKIRIVEEKKRLVQGVKTEELRARTTKRKTVVKLLRNFGSVSSAIAKERLKLNYSGRLPNIDSEECTLCVSLDKLVPFSLHKMRASSGAIFHMDIDGDRSCSHTNFVGTEFFKTNIAPKVTRLDLSTSKWKLGRSNEPYSLASIEYVDVESMLIRAMDSLAERKPTRGAH